VQAINLHNKIYNFFYDSATKLFIEKVNGKIDKPYSYLWPLCGLVQAANEMEVLYPGQKFLPPVIQAINQYYSTKSPSPGYHSYVFAQKDEARFYDDNQWIGIAYMDAYERSKDSAYLLLSAEIYNFMMTGFDTVCNGGLYWKEGDLTTKNTCSNGPGILLALQLYNATNQKKYLDTALLLYNWTNEQLLAKDGVYYDAVQLPSKKIDKRKFAYNTGTMLQANVMLFAITKNKMYLQRAQQMAAASLRYFYKQNSFPDNYWFNAVLMRGYVALNKITSNPVYINAYKKYAALVMQQQRDTRGLIGKHTTKDLLDQAGMLEILARLAQMQQ
jgi:hypothetical protein